MLVAAGTQAKLSAARTTEAAEESLLHARVGSRGFSWWCAQGLSPRHAGVQGAAGATTAGGGKLWMHCALLSAQ